MEYDRDWVLRTIDDDPALRALLRDVRARLDGDPGHDLEHCYRVAAWTARFCGAEIAPRIAVAAALLHDAVNVPKSSPDRPRASERSAALAADLLPRRGFDAAEVASICEAIRDHSYSRGARPSTTLGASLQDADRLEALGAIGIFRAVSTGTRMGAAYFHAADPWAAERSLDDRAYTLDHFFTKLLSLPETLCTEAGRAEARRRAALMADFVAALGREMGSPPPAMLRDDS